jgi:hypothetical protein
MGARSHRLVAFCSNYPSSLQEHSVSSGSLYFPRAYQQRLTRNQQLREGSAYWRCSRSKEDYEALQYSRACEEDVP